jgi:hypothetical protein
VANLDFYAAREDMLLLLGSVFDETDCHVYESHSEYDRELRRFKRVDELAAAFPLGTDDGGHGVAVTLQLWSPSAGGKLRFERIELRPRTGHNHRFEVAGWGLMQVYLGGVGPRGISASHFGHNSEKRARAWSDTYDDLGSPDDWDWVALMRVSRRLQYHIRSRLSDVKRGSRPVLRHAEALWRSGVDLIE